MKKQYSEYIRQIFKVIKYFERDMLEFHFTEVKMKNYTYLRINGKGKKVFGKILGMLPNGFSLTLPTINNNVLSFDITMNVEDDIFSNTLTFNLVNGAFISSVVLDLTNIINLHKAEYIRVLKNAQNEAKTTSKEVEMFYDYETESFCYTRNKLSSYEYLLLVTKINKKGEII